MMKTIDTAEPKECYGDNFKCNECKIVNSGWKIACRRQCEYNWEHRNSHIARPRDDDEWDIPGQYQSY